MSTMTVYNNTNEYNIGDTTGMSDEEIQDVIDEINELTENKIKAAFGDDYEIEFTTDSGRSRVETSDRNNDDEQAAEYLMNLAFDEWCSK